MQIMTYRVPALVRVFPRVEMPWSAPNERGEPRPRLITEEPVFVTAYWAYLEQRGRYQRDDELPRDSGALSIAHAAEIYHNSKLVPAYDAPNYIEHLLTEWHLSERARYVPPPYKFNVVEA